jgi:hypothetical protein
MLWDGATSFGKAVAFGFSSQIEITASTNCLQAVPHLPMQVQHAHEGADSKIQPVAMAIA